MIDIGLMRERVLIQSPRIEQSPFGEATTEWVNVVEVWASVRGLNSREVLQAQQANAIVTHVVRIRLLDELTHQHRLIWRGRILEISSLMERETRLIHEIMAREVA
ncbi:MAG: head-tail adaptor protein [Caulobacteraceae bacterium]|nr:head-tail adaptor protein [Caulobacteraceae bacterium]